MAERTEHLEAVLLSAVRPSQEQEKRFLAFLAEKYGADSTFASKCTAISTVLSLITTPLWCLVV